MTPTLPPAQPVHMPPQCLRAPQRLSCSVHGPGWPYTSHPAADLSTSSSPTHCMNSFWPLPPRPRNSLPNPFSTGFSSHTKPMAVQVLTLSLQAIPTAFPEPSRSWPRPAPSQYLCLELIPLCMHCPSCESQLSQTCVSSPQGWPGSRRTAGGSGAEAAGLSLMPGIRTQGAEGLNAQAIPTWGHMGSVAPLA